MDSIGRLGNKLGEFVEEMVKLAVGAKGSGRRSQVLNYSIPGVPRMV